MALASGQVRILSDYRDLLMGEGTLYDLQSEVNPFIRGVRAPQTGQRPYAHGSYTGAEWQNEAVVPIRVIANGANKDVPSTRAAIQAMSAGFAAKGNRPETIGLYFRLDGDPDEYVLFGTTRGFEPDLSTMGEGWVYASASFVAQDPRIYSAVESSLSLSLPVQTGGLTIPARPATTRLRLPGASGSYASTPDSTALHITGDLGVRALAHRTSWSGPASEETLAARYDDSTDDRSWRFSLNANGTLRFQWSTDGLSAQSASSSVAVPAGATTLAVGAYIDVATGDVVFETSDGIDGAWVPLGSTQTGSPTSIHAGTSDLVVGARNGGATAPWDGVVYQVEVRDGGPSGSVVADPDFTAQATGTTAFTDSAGILWTVHGTAQIIGDPIHTGTITPSLGGRIWLKSIRHPFLNRVIEVVDFSDVTRVSGTVVQRVSGRSTPVAVAGQRAAPAFELEVLTTTAEASRDLDLSLVSGDTFLVHLPAGCPVPGGYVTVGDTSTGRLANRTARRRHRLPCQVAAPPGPGIVGTTLTWRTVLRLYGSSTALINANPTWRDLLATVGSPDDVVVI